MARAYSQTRHGEYLTRLYQIWRGIKNRTEGHASNFILYGARGITMCCEWRDYLRFRDWAIAHGYDDERQIDRINADGPYSPENCRWVLPIVNYARKELPRDGAYLADLSGNLDQAMIDGASPRARPYKLHDGLGLFLRVCGRSRSWRFKFDFAGKEQLLVLGVYPGLSLLDARELRLVMRRRLKRGVNPCDVRRESVKRRERRLRAKASRDTDFNVGVRGGVPARMGMAENSQF